MLGKAKGHAKIHIVKKKLEGNSLVIKWLGLCSFTDKGQGTIPSPDLWSGNYNHARHAVWSKLTAAK